MGPLTRIPVLGLLSLLAVAAHVSAQSPVTAPAPPALANVAKIPFSRIPRVHRVPGNTTNRLFFAKVSYLLRF